MKNYYDTLEVPTNASAQEIQQGYMRIKNTYSQNSLALYSLIDQHECKQILDSIEEAYSILSDPEKRVRYDEARGINNSASQNSSADPSRSIAELVSQNASNFSSSSGQFIGNAGDNITKIVAKRIYDITYDRNEEFEKEIEEATEFSGEFLRKIREYKNISVTKMIDMTKVSKTYLSYIEEENYKSLPAMVYVRGFVYQYAKCLRLNPDLVATSYMARIKTLQDDNKKHKK